MLCGALPLLASSGAQAQWATSPPDGDVQVGAPGDDAYADTDPSALTDFRPALDPHGTWTDDPAYGTVWTPNPDEVGADFQPYDTAGQWDYDGTDYSWQSSFSWGWVCFHYGRWAYNQSTGWMWIPGRTYAPAWVSWRLGDDAYPYVGWAPIPPAWLWFGGGATAFGVVLQEPWTFTGRSNVLSSSIASSSVHGSSAAALVPRTKPYVPATPGVGSPSYVAATPQVSQTPFTQPIPHGPPPALLGIDGSVIKRPPPRSGELRARQFARPSTAQPLGARGPTPHLVHMGPRGSSGGTATPRSANPGASGEGRAGGGRGRR